MTIFYRGPCIVITHRDFRVLCPLPQVLPICEIRHLHAVEFLGLARPVSIGSSGIAGVLAVVTATGGLDLPVPLLFVGGILLLAAAALAGACVRSPRRYELWAIYCGRPVLLLNTSDAQVFGQVKRALLRALEQSRDM
jgi:hypothetical protein